jgi:hypothetical protein
MRRLGLLAAILSLLPRSLAAGPAPTGCHSVGLSMTPKWIASAAYVPALQKILVVDSALSRLLLVSPDGRTEPMGGVLAERATLPALVTPSEDGFLLLRLKEPSLLKLDEGLNLRPESDLRRTSVAGAAPGSLYEWTVSGSTVLAYGTVQTPGKGRSYELGFLRFPVSTGPARPEMLLPFSDIGYYVFGYQYLTSIGPVGYFLALDKEATLYRVPPGGGAVARPNAVPPAFRSLPELPKPMTGPGDAQKFYAELAGKTMPAGIYGGEDGFLYLMTRQPAPRGATDWTLYRIDAEGNKILGHGSLRTKAKHLTVVPSKNAWYFFERGEVTPTGSQEINSMLVVDADRLTALGAAGADLCPEAGR